MLTCIACSKQLNAGGSCREKQVDDEAAGTPTTKHSVKSITAQLKDMAVKASGAYKNCKPCSGSSRSQNYAESEATSASGRFYGPYRRADSSSSTPRQWGKEMESRLKGISSGEGTPVSVSGRVDAVVFMVEDEPKEWVAQVEPGVLITFVSLPQGGNTLKRIQFSREMFNKWEAQRWWGQNYERVMELYNVQRSIRQAEPLNAPPRSEDESSKLESTESSPATPPLNETRLPRNLHHPRVSSDSLDPYAAPCESNGLASAPKHSDLSTTKTEAASANASARTSSSQEPKYSGERSVSNASEADNEWVEQDEPGVYITLRALPGGIRELRRVRFSRERFGEMHARLWWEENRARIQEQYL
uniref:BRX domain-containing protein n=1 Tax=Kalanchoe fedtschenkoi TaxID=63787 RepID=A0A7N0TYD0_KALFE